MFSVWFRRQQITHRQKSSGSVTHKRKSENRRTERKHTKKKWKCFNKRRLFEGRASNRNSEVKKYEKEVTTVASENL